LIWSQLQVQIKQLVSQAYQQWDQMEEVQNEMALVDKSLIPFHDEKPMISSGMPSNETAVAPLLCQLYF
jgi:hypothetical protein